MTIMMALLRFASVVLLLVTLVYADDYYGDDYEDQSCAADGTCGSGCEDKEKNCEFWAEQGECQNNAVYMKATCPKSCDLCGKGQPSLGLDDIEPADDEFGVAQVYDTGRIQDIEKATLDMKAYFRKLREDPETTTKMLEILDNCKNKHESCAFWKVIGECEENPQYMKMDCSAICQTCDFLSIDTRCPLDPEAPQAWGPGDLDKFFVNITTLPEFQKFEPHVISRPDYINGDTEETADYQIGPWVATLDNFLTIEETERLIQLGHEEGYERSSDVGKMKFDGTFEPNVNDGRTSKNAWCQHECYNDTVAQQVIGKITEITNLPEENSEFLQLLRYEEGQYYRTHHDYIEFQKERQAGVRILTIFLYLNDVEEGGGTNFPHLRPKVTVNPKRGRALIWPSVLDENPDDIDSRTHHQALAVEKGLKYGANAWVHMRDFKTPNRNNCQ
eukprot:CAMPEP_0119004118 /NCGR_PEP_ID=MMETSP1176-20130426/962_1 /TAXON_ID=265551 /ORGANISM="Synedropsis recta cf, Strain CCMP1620" /LENGTH=445 /DNA_ID=CAMNT_0006955793 /DNA_START=11 /DNA_END=1348 /DNA_ORIENTATION=+